MNENQNPRLRKGLIHQYPLIYVQTREEPRLEEQLQTLSREHYGDDRPVTLWTVASSGDPLDMIRAIREGERDGFFLLKDLPLLFEGNPVLVRALRDFYRDMAGKNRFLILSCPLLKLPEDLKSQIWLVDMQIPDEKEILAYLKHHLEAAADTVGLADEWYFQVASAMKGLTLDEVWHLLQGWINERRFELEAVLSDVYADKTAALQKEGCLEFISKQVTVDQVGGLENLKEWVANRKVLFSREAFESGVPLPAGILFMGISGCGKSMASKLIAGAWNLPLIRLDMNLVMSGAYGSPEFAFDSALKTADLISPIVLWIDEMENSFGYDGESSGGSSSIFSSFLTWMQEKSPKIFVVATANRIQKLPAEVLRKGRFDELFFLDLPTDEERRAIFRIHIRTYGADPDTFNMNLLSVVTRGWSGAEIEQVVKAARIEAYQAERMFDEKDIAQAGSQMVPLSRTMEEQIKHLRQWSQTRATPASRR